jgi:peptide/nickel transport system substrate-binding protein
LGLITLLLGAGALAWAAAPADTLVIGKASDPQNLDPGITIDNNDWTVTYPCYQRLMRYKVEKGRGSTSVEGDLAANWKVSKDNLTWEFKLRKGQQFDDGSAVDAAAVKFSFERLMKLAQGPSEPFPSDLKVAVVDPLTVRFTMTKVCPYFLYTLANNGTGIVNPKVMARPDAGPDAKTFLSAHTAGSGAFRLASWEKSQSLVLEPNPHFNGKTTLKKVVVKIIGEASSRRLLLESGDLDIVESLPVDQLNEVAKKPDLRVAKDPSLRVTYLYLNNKKGPLSNPAVRQAISWAVDYHGIVQNVLKNQAQQMRGAIPEGMWGYDPSVMQYGTDLKKAKAILDQAHVGNLKLDFLYSARDANWETIALSTQANLATLGISVKLENMANATMRERIGKADYDISIGNWSPDFADPYMFMNYWFDSEKQGLPGNRSFYANADVDRLVRQAASIVDQKQRTALYQQAQRTVVNEAAYVYLYQANSQIAMRKAVKGFVFNPMLESIYNVETMSK